MCSVCLAGGNFSLSSDRCTGSCPHQIRFWSIIHLISSALFKPIQTWSLYVILTVGMWFSLFALPHLPIPHPVPHKAPWLLPPDWLMMMQWCMTEEAAWFKTHAGDRFPALSALAALHWFKKGERRHENRKMILVILQNLYLNLLCISEGERIMILCQRYWVLTSRMLTQAVFFSYMHQNPAHVCVCAATHRKISAKVKIDVQHFAFSKWLH